MQRLEDTPRLGGPTAERREREDQCELLALKGVELHSDDGRKWEAPPAAPTEFQQQRPQRRRRIPSLDDHASRRGGLAGVGPAAAWAMAR